MKNNQKGFGVVEILIVTLVISLLGAAGWLVYDRKQSDKNSQLSTQPSRGEQAVGEVPESNELPEGYIGYSNNDLGVKFNYPKDWGDVSTSQWARNREDYEPVKTHLISFSRMPKFVINISPNSWEFTGGQGSWDFPETDASFQRRRNSKDSETLQILSKEEAYLNIEYAGIDGTVVLRGAKKIELSKIPAKYVEFHWNPVGDDCTIGTTDGTRKPQVSCYEQDLVNETQKILESFEAN